jgi:hypothetical protein
VYFIQGVLRLPESKKDMGKCNWGDAPNARFNAGVT